VTALLAEATDKLTDQEGISVRFRGQVQQCRVGPRPHGVLDHVGDRVRRHRRHPHNCGTGALQHRQRLLDRRIWKCRRTTSQIDNRHHDSSNIIVHVGFLRTKNSGSAFSPKLQRFAQGRSCSHRRYGARLLVGCGGRGNARLQHGV
jgi:hypothetical protein